MALRVKVNTPPATEEMPEELPVEEPLEAPAEMPEEPMMLPMAGGGQVAQDVARYLGPDAVCQNCIHFLEPNTCEIVAGPIDPQGRCSLFTPDSVEPDVESGMPESDMPPADIPPDEY